MEIDELRANARKIRTRMRQGVFANMEFDGDNDGDVMYAQRGNAQPNEVSIAGFFFTQNYARISTNAEYYLYDVDRELLHKVEAQQNAEVRLLDLGEKDLAKFEKLMPKSIYDLKKKNLDADRQIAIDYLKNMLISMPIKATYLMAMLNESPNKNLLMHLISISGRARSEMVASEDAMCIIQTLIIILGEDEQHSQ